jgi:hypothetical protein
MTKHEEHFSVKTPTVKWVVGIDRRDLLMYIEDGPVEFGLRSDGMVVWRRTEIAEKSNA